MADSDPTQPVQVHPARTVTTPDGETVEVDELMAPLVQALWAAGYATIMCCQDAGQAVRAGGTNTPVEHRPLYGDYYEGLAWVKLPINDMIRLRALTRALAENRRWMASVPILPDGMAPWASLHFPADQIGDVTGMLRSAHRDAP
ncbi:hypothetical protein [Actinomadura harenae]|uniref:Uncharacterized protein n=1 Tax=Actinomadura harenae TaxID=2483351 RepID=A0A3M2LJ41_9ACTN|nr:hypothetical protein [Actinomadura harenae]RMI37497.1 hypothetical protein EBO15_35630 [Actinomadura harenae]